jgi:erythritol transport system substrate-binding protein
MPTKLSILNKQKEEKTMLKRLSIVVCIIIMLSINLSACKPAPVAQQPTGAQAQEEVATTAPSTEEQQASKKKLVVIITSALSNAFFKTESDTAVEELTKLGYETNLMIHNDDPKLQAEQIDAAISLKAAAILLDNAGADASVGPVTKATEAGIPVFIIDREMTAKGIAKVQLLANNYQGGTLAGKEFVRLMGEEGEYAELIGPEWDMCALLRTSGAHEVIDQYPNMKMVAQQMANWDQAEGFSKMETILQANPNIKGVICGNDTMCLGAQAALEEAGKTDVFIVGFDGHPDAFELIKQGKYSATVLEPMVVYTRMGVKAIDDYLKTGSTGYTEEKTLVDCVLITKENVNKFTNFEQIEP